MYALKAVSQKIIFILLVFTLVEGKAFQAENETSLDSMLLDAVAKSNALQFDEAHDAFTKLIQEAEKRKDRKNQVLATINLGALYLKYNAFDEALKYFLQSLELAEKYDQEQFLNTIYNNIGIVYSSNNGHDKAIAYFEKALLISRKMNIDHRIAVNLVNLATELHKNRDDEEKSLQYFRESYRIFHKREDELNASVVLNNMGDIYMSRNQDDSAMYFYKKAVGISDSLREKFYAPHFYLSLGKLYYKLKRFSAAEEALQKSLSGYKSIQSTAGIIETYTWLSLVAESGGNTKDALILMKQSLAWRDTLQQEKASKWLSELQMRYEFGKKENEIKLLQLEAEQQQQRWITFLAIGLLVAVLVFFVFRIKMISLRQQNIILKKEQEVNRLTLERNEAARQKRENEILANEKLNALEKERLKQELTFKDRELAAKALHLVNKNETFGHIEKLLSTIDFHNPDKVKPQIDKIIKVVKGNENLDKEWEIFKMHFQEVHPDFFMSLQTHYPSLSQNDLRLCAYLLIDLNSKEIANIFNISPESVRKKKQRLREKLNLERDEDITLLLHQFKKSGN